MQRPLQLFNLCVTSVTKVDIVFSASQAATPTAVGLYLGTAVLLASSQ